MRPQAPPPERDRWVVLLERAAPWLVAGIVAAMVVLGLLAAILGASWAGP